jgi:hypothetical protein
MSLSSNVQIVQGEPLELKSEMPPLFPQDVMIVSYPRSGNTWVRFLLANLIADSQQPLDFVEMEQFIPAIHNVQHWDRIRTMPPGRFIKSHMPYDPAYKKVIYIVRDGRDVMVSYYHFCTPYKFQGTFLQYLQKQSYFWPCPWHTHVESWLDHMDNQSLLLVRYQDLLNGPAEQLRRITDFIALSTDEERIARAVRHSSFDSMQKMEEEKKVPRLLSDYKFFRKGLPGSWKDFFGPEHKDVFKPYANRVLLRLGYIESPDW